MLAMVCVIGCSSKKAEEGLQVGVLANPVSLDPRVAVDAEGSKITSLMFDGLMALDDELELVPALAERYEMLDETTYRLHLRKGVKFHSGVPFTAKDVVYTYHSLMDPATRSPYKSAFDRVKKVEAEDDHTVLIKLKEPYAPFLTMLQAKILSSADMDRPIGTGRYVLESFTPESRVALKANADYWNGRPKQDRIVFHIIKDDNVRVLKLMKGDVDLVQNGVPPLLVEKLLDRKNLAMKNDIGIVATYMGLNLTDPILKNKKVRQAIARAIDVDSIIRWRWRGLAIPAASIISPALWAYDTSLEPISYDPAKAKRLLDEAGFPDPDGDGPGVRFELVYKTTTVKARIDIARMIAQQLGEVGIGINMKTYEWGTFFRDVRTGNFQMYTLSWVGITEPDIFYDVCHSTQMPPKGLNRDRYSNPEIDRLVELGRVTMDQDVRKKIYAKVQKILLEDLPFIPLWYEKNWVMYQRNLSGVSLRPDAAYLPFAEVWQQAPGH
jgi:peptide/nickel transport system substrate-binding protein